MPPNSTSILLQSLFYVMSGVSHFWHPNFYLQIMPDHYSHPDTLVRISGAAEILGGIGLSIPATRRVAALGIIVLLVVFLDVHQFMLSHAERFPQLPKWMLWARLPVQAILIAWAWRYAQKRKQNSRG